jgi:hypothetical protein
MATFNDILKGESDDGYGIPSDAYIKYQMDNMDRVEHTYEDEMATYIDALNGDHTDGREQFPQMDENKRVELEEMIATKLLEVVSQDDLENAYYDMQKEWAESMPDEELMETARELGITFEEK